MAADDAEFGDIVAALDALAEPKRDVARLGRRASVFNLTFSIASTMPTSSRGRLPPEIVQRVVRQNFGTLRKCYETGLKKNANLSGKVTTAFVIGLDGEVSSATADPASDMPDRAVVACVVKGMSALSFPAPEGGTVRVVYPIQFSPGAP